MEGTTINHKSSQATLMEENQLLFGKGLLGHYQNLINESMSWEINYGRGGLPDLGSAFRRRNARASSFASTGNAAGGSSSVPATVNVGSGSSTAANMQQGLPVTGGVLLNCQDSINQLQNLQGGMGARWRHTTPESASGAANPNAKLPPGGRGRGGGRGGRKKKTTGITINVGGRGRRATGRVVLPGISINEGGRTREGQVEGYIPVAAEVASGGGGVSKKGKEKVGEGKGKEKVGETTLERFAGDIEREFQDQYENNLINEDPMYNIVPEDYDLRINWQGVGADITGQTTSSQNPPADN